MMASSDYSEEVKGSAAEPYLLWFSGPEEAPLQQVLEGLLGKKKSKCERSFTTWRNRENHTGMVKRRRSGADGSAQNPVRWNSVVSELSAQTAVIAIKVHLLMLIR